VGTHEDNQFNATQVVHVRDQYQLTDLQKKAGESFVEYQRYLASTVRINTAPEEIYGED